ncbi:MAG: L,D-transpeptidase family protein, partial [Longimicrobiales bacterium]
SDGDTIVLSAPVIAFYRDRGYRQAWTDYDEIRERGWSLLQAMEHSAEDGLDPERYRFPVALRMVQQVEEDSIPEEDEPAQMASVDMVLSEVFGRYANHIAGGVLEPNQSGLNWQIPKDTVDVHALLTRLASDEEPGDIVTSLRPAAPEYHALMAQLERYRAIAANGGWPEVTDAVPEEVGETGDGVASLRTRLIAEGDPEEVRLAQSGSAAASTFDADLKAALEHFQNRHALQPDGRVGASTLEELNVPATDRVQQILLNMDQWRWLPRELGERYILVNVAGFELEYVKNDSVALAMNVVVGQEGWETPIFTDTMEHLVVNPYWNVPASIEREEVIPAIQRDAGYLARNNMEAVVGNRVVGASGLDYGNLEQYSFRQRPGTDNALGQVKFLFPNKNNIYLHDTPADQLFSAHSRAFSHGCIRLEKPLDLARMLLDDVTERPSDQLDDLISRKSEQWVPVTAPLPVYILYFTAWAGRDATMRFYPDVYERDRRLEEQVQEELQVSELG